MLLHDAALLGSMAAAERHHACWMQRNQQGEVDSALMAVHDAERRSQQVLHPKLAYHCSLRGARLCAIQSRATSWRAMQWNNARN